MSDALTMMSSCGPYDDHVPCLCWILYVCRDVPCLSMMTMHASPCHDRDALGAHDLCRVPCHDAYLC